MKSYVLILALLLCTVLHADTPAPGRIRVIGNTDGTIIGNVSDSLKETVTSSALPTGGSTSALQTQIDTDLLAFKAANHTDLLGINTTLGSPFQAGGSIGNTQFGAAQIGTWTTGRTWSLSHSTDTLQSWLFDGAGNSIGSTGGALNVSVATLPLPSGAATSALQTTGNASLSTIASNQTNGNQIIQLPVGAATAANQTTANTSLATIVTNTTGLATSSNQTNGNQKTQAVDGSGNVYGPAVVIGSENSVPTAPQQATPDLTASGSLTAQCTTPTSCPGGSTVTISNVNGLGSMILEIQGTWVGTITVEGSNDAGANWNARSIVIPAPSQLSSAGVSANGYYRVTGVSSYGILRARMTAFTSGSATTGLRVSTGPDIVGVVQTNPSNLQPLINGMVNSSVQSLTTGQYGQVQLDPRGGLLNVPLDGIRPTYTASTTLTVAATATDIYEICGSASKTIRVMDVLLYPTETTAGLKQIFLIKRSSANTGGTSTTMTNVPNDPNSAAATATILAYTANPATLGTSLGNVRISQTNTGPETTTDPQGTIDWPFGVGPAQGQVLRGAASCLSVNLNGVTFTGGVVAASFTWTEE